jgi:chemotaxis protein histidine kinase CheA
VSTETAADFDLGPLSWVQSEIDQALARGLESLAAFKLAPNDPSTLKHARMHVHQAAGAIQMVGLDAVVAFTDEIERQLARLEELEPRLARGACDAIDRACRKLRIFLDELVNGAHPVTLKLFPEYEAMQRQRGIKASAPTDLFYPDLSPRAPKLSTPQSVAPAKLQSFMVKQRRHYQRGLLAWLRGDDEGARTMRDAVAGIESVTTHANLRAFWWTTGALLDALTERGLESSFGVKQLAARIDLQIRRVVEGSAKVADRLRREVLYYVAISAPVAPSVQAVQRGFKLAGLIPSAEVLNADLVRLQPLLREAREQLGSAKEAWLKFTSGRAENLPKLKQTLASVHKAAAEIGNGALMRLTSSLVERLDKMPSGAIPEPLAMEYATAMLLAESAFENQGPLAADFPKQVDAMLARLDAARASRPVPAAAAPVLDEMAKRAQERLLLAQVGREIQANLRHMEQVLDAFFRDNSKRAELASLAKDTKQIRGALRILGLDDADKLLASCQSQIEAYAQADTPVSNDELELLARDAGSGVVVERARADFPELLARASISVSQAGYNTVLDVVRSGARPVLVPFAEHGETEQRMRADRLRELNLAVVVDGLEVSGTALAGAIDAGLGALEFRLRRRRALGRAHHGDARREARSASGRLCVNAWQSLDAELGRWRTTGRRATLWWRDDDAYRDSPALQRLLGLAEAAALPVALAAIPATLEPSLAAAVARSRFATVVQHGYAHRNHAPPEERKTELGLHRDVETTMAELARGLDILRRSFGEQFLAVLVPPWNRIDGEIVARLPDVAFRGLSTLGPRKARCCAPGLLQCNTHVDVIAWQRKRSFIGVEAALDRLVAHLRARRDGSADPDEPTGLLTHHVDLSDAGWEFVVQLVARTRDCGAAWLG